MTKSNQKTATAAAAAASTAAASAALGADEKQAAAAAATGTASAKTTPIKKLSIKTVCGQVLIKDIPADGELLLARMSGIAMATDQGESTYGIWQCLKGQFAAKDYRSGKMFVGATAFVPGAMGDMLFQSLNSAQSEDASATLRFSVDISVEVSKRDPNKYEYIVRPVIESDLGNQALSLLEYNPE